MSALETLPAIGLDALVSEASLMTRIDRKYLVPAEIVEQVFGAIDTETRALEIDGDRRFQYHSVYFDTPELASYHTAAHPRRRRFKVRTRHYVDTGGAFLEVKLRGARGATQKDRVPHAAEELEHLNRAARSEVAEALVGIADAEGIAMRLQPTLASLYRRATLLAPDGESRATFDTSLTWIDQDGSELRMDEHAIIETKSSSRPSEIDRCLWALGHRPRSMSKYATGLATLRPELPSNRWHRTIARTGARPVRPGARRTVRDLQRLGR